MGEKLKEIYKVTTKKAGFIGRMKLAEKTGIPLVKAAESEDLDEVIKKFKEAATEIIGKNKDEFLEKYNEKYNLKNF